MDLTRPTTRAAAALLAAGLVLVARGPALGDSGEAAGVPPGEPVLDRARAHETALARALAVEDRLVETTERVRLSTVAVLCRRGPAAKNVAPPPRQLDHGGSGVIVSYGQRTWILTNEHVVAGAGVIEVVTSDGRRHAAELVDTVQRYDIALLKFSHATTGLRPVAVLPRPSRELAQGQWVLATGNPFFLAMDGAAVATLGVVSGLDRVLGGAQLYAGAVQHDAPVNPGNSGGPLWNIRGELVGINGMIAARSGGGGVTCNTGASFSIPIDQIEPYLAQLVDAKRDARAGTLGLDARTSTDETGTPNGAEVVQIRPGSPVIAGPEAIEAGDVIVALIAQTVPMNAQARTVTIRTASDLANALAILPCDTPVKLRLRRRGRAVEWSGKLAPQG